jgi:hypothetical protein
MRLVDLAMLQGISYVAAAIGVCIAAIYYVPNLRTVQRNMRITLSTNLMQSMLSEESMRRWGN